MKTLKTNLKSRLTGLRHRLRQTDNVMVKAQIQDEISFLEFELEQEDERSHEALRASIKELAKETLKTTQDLRDAIKSLDESLNKN